VRVLASRTRSGRRLLIGALLAAAAACSSSPTSRASSSTTASKTISTSRVPVLRRLPAWSRRTFAIHVVLERGAAVAVGIHPNPEPISVKVSPPLPAELCAASVTDGTIDDQASCVAVDAAGRASTPPTNGAVHIAFAVRARSSRAVQVSVIVRYAAEDPFVLVVPPVGSVNGMSVDFTPRTATAGANAYLLPGYRPAPAIYLTMRQAGRLMHDPRPCDFLAEIDCLGRVQANQPTVISAAARAATTGKAALYIVWQ
jgi:hypothetical protein